MNDNEEIKNSVSDQEKDFIVTIENLTPRESACLRLVCNEDLNLNIPEMSSDLFKRKLLRYEQYKMEISREMTSSFGVPS